MCMFILNINVNVQFWRLILGERLQNLFMFWLARKTSCAQWRLGGTAGWFEFQFWSTCKYALVSFHNLIQLLRLLFMMQWSWKGAWTSIFESWKAEEPVQEARIWHQISDACWGCTRGSTCKFFILRMHLLFTHCCYCYKYYSRNNMLKLTLHLILSLWLW